MPPTLDSVAVSAAPFVALLAVGCLVTLIGVVWFLRTKHLRSMWKRANHDVTKVAIMLELEDRVRELESSRGRNSAGPP